MKQILLLTFCALCTLVSCKEQPKKAPSDISATAEGEVASQDGVVPEIIPISHATAILRWGETTIYIDPVGEVANFSEYPEPDLILVTDVHGDHFSLETLEALQTENSKIVTPQAVADLMPDSFTPQIDVLNNGEDKERFGIQVRAIPMYNLREEARQFHAKGRGNGYVLEKEGIRVYFSGDTEDIPEMRALQDIDMAFVCMNLPYTMTVKSAADAVLEFKPAMVYPYHYRGNPDVSDVEQFKDLVAAGDTSIEVIQLDWYPNAPY